MQIFFQYTVWTVKSVTAVYLTVDPAWIAGVNSVIFTNLTVDPKIHTVDPSKPGRVKSESFGVNSEISWHRTIDPAYFAWII